MFRKMIPLVLIAAILMGGGVFAQSKKSPTLILSPKDMNEINLFCRLSDYNIQNLNNEQVAFLIQSLKREQLVSSNHPNEFNSELYLDFIYQLDKSSLDNALVDLFGTKLSKTTKQSLFNSGQVVDHKNVILFPMIAMSAETDKVPMKGDRLWRTAQVDKITAVGDNTYTLNLTLTPFISYPPFDVTDKDLKDMAKRGEKLINQSTIQYPSQKALMTVIKEKDNLVIQTFLVLK